MSANWSRLGQHKPSLRSSLRVVLDIKLIGNVYTLRLLARSHPRQGRQNDAVLKRQSAQTDGLEQRIVDCD